MKKKVFFILLILVTLKSSAQFNFTDYALHHLNIVDVKTKNIFRNYTIIIHEGYIKEIVPTNEYIQNDSIQSILLKNKYVVPGLIDAHVHFATNPSLERRDNAEMVLKQMLLSGITSVRDMAGDARALSGLSRNALVGDIEAPTIYYAALMAGTDFFSDPRTIATAQGGVSGQMSYMKAIDDDSNIPLEIAEAKGSGASGIKLYAKLSEDQIIAISKEAKQQSIPVWAHASLYPVKPSSIIPAGILSISHVNMLLDEFTNTNTDLIPLWEKHQNSKNDNAFWDQQFDQLDFKPLYNLMIQNNVILDATISVLENYKDKPKNRWKYELGIRIVKNANKYGVRIAAGSDTDQKTFVQHEMDLMVNLCDFTPLEAIIAATENSASAIGASHSEGSIEVGKRANLLIVNENPTQDINNINDVFLVVNKGKLYNPIK